MTEEMITDVATQPLSPVAAAPASRFEADLEALIVKARDMGVRFHRGPATLETANDPMVFHVLEDMADEVFYEALDRKLSSIGDRAFMRILSRLEILS